MFQNDNGDNMRSMSSERHLEGGSSTPLIDKYSQSFVLPIIDKMIERNPNDEFYIQFVKSLDLVVAGAFSVAGLIPLAAVELPLTPIAKKIQKTLHPNKETEIAG